MVESRPTFCGMIMCSDYFEWRIAMPALPWRNRHAIAPDHDYLVMASRLPLKAHRFIPGFLVDTLRIRRQLARTEGLVAYALNAQLAHKTFWTYSVWIDQESLDAFAGADPHRRIIQGLRSRMGESRFEFMRMQGSEIPSDWSAMQDPVR